MNKHKQVKKVVVVGSGFAGIYTVKNMHKYFCREENISVSMITPNNYFLFSPFLHEVATGGISVDNIVEPIREILGCCIGKIHLETAKRINTKEKIIETNKEKIPYDYLVLAPGSETNFYNIKGAEEFSYTLKDLHDAIKIKNCILDRIERAAHSEDPTERKGLLSFVIVGGGATGVEIATELEELVKDSFSRYYSRGIIGEISIKVIQGDRDLLTQFSPSIRDKSHSVLKSRGVEVMLNTIVEEVRIDKVVTNNGKEIGAGMVIWVAGIKPKDIAFDIEPEKIQGRLLVDEYLRLKNHKNIFALGDVATLIDKNGKTIPTLAQAAQREAKTVAKNLFLAIKSRPLEIFKYKSKGSMISLGQWSAAVEIYGFVFLGPIAWWIWRTYYLFKIISLRKKIKIALDWTINIFRPRDISRI